MKLSVVIPCSNAEARLERSVSSVVEQAVPETEIIVVDDASTDGTAALAERLGARVRDFALRRLGQKSGSAGARNAGLGAARGDYVAFLDAGDAYGPDAFARAIADLDRFPWIDGVEIGVRLVDCHREVAPPILALYAGALAGNVIVRRPLALSVGGFPMEDDIRAVPSGESAAYRMALRRWGTIGAMDQVHLARTIRRGGSFDRFMDGVRIDGGRVQFLPDEARERGDAATRAHLRRVDDAILGSIGTPALQAIPCAIADRQFAFELPARPEAVGRASDLLRHGEFPTPPSLGPIKTVLDADAETGASAVYFAATYPGARVVALEPTRAGFILLRRNAAAHGNLETYRTGLAGATARIEIVHASTGTREEVQMANADALARSLRLEQIDLLRLSNRGYEVPALVALGPRLGAIKAIFIRYLKDADRRAIDAILGPSHKLAWGRSARPDQGELLYMQRTLLGADGAF
jgi:hypothetical protein